MADLENAVRKAATALYDACVAAETVGYRVQMPSSIDGLLSIAISETRQLHVIAIQKRMNDLEQPNPEPPRADLDGTRKPTFFSAPKKPKDKD